nr:MAG TPA: hypothetical protein [Caudoviricetes sp.]
MLKPSDLTIEDAQVIGAYRGKPCYIDLARLAAFHFESSHLIALRAIDKARRA